MLLDTPTRNRVQFQQNEINELNSFEQLEQVLNGENSILEMDRERFDQNLILQYKLGFNLAPKTIAEVDEEDEIEEEQANVDSKSISHEKEAFPSTSSPYSKSTESFQKFKEKLFDRRLKQKFKNRLSVAKDFEISDVISSNRCEFDDDGVSSSISTNDTSIDDCEHLKSDFQERLSSLEKEIQSFREQNMELTKMIREHEMIRLTFDQEKSAEEERLQNERVTFEMYMHDERMKLLTERTEWEKKMKETRSLNRSEKDELIRLREKCGSHETELNARDQKHVAAQARVRAQLRNVEKELKEMNFDVENLRRENKKLETENIRLRRQSNNKLLNEINKNISKLAHSTDSNNQCENEKEEITERNKHGVKKCSNKNAHKTVVAKVTSHQEPTKNVNRLRSRSVPNLNQMENTDNLCNPCVSDAENSIGSSNEEEQSSYFPNSTARKNNSIANNTNEKFTFNQSDIEQDTSSANASFKRVIENSDGSKDVWYPNGNLKKISSDGMYIRMLYFNKDIKETDIKEGTVKYYYAETNTWQTTYLDGLEIFEYPK